MLDAFHPAVGAWFGRALGEPTPPQQAAWPAIRQGRHVLVCAPTGSGKTLAAFLAALDELVRGGLAGELPDEVRVVYVSPLKALSNDVEKNLQQPLAGIRQELAAAGLPDVAIRTAVRTGDTPASERAALTRTPPHVLVTTPESLFILLTSDGGRNALRTARTVIVDEVHALAPNRRGSHLALSLERLDALCGRRLQRIGLSATQDPIEEVARFLVGTPAVAPDGVADCVLVDTGHARRLDLGIELPRSPLTAVMSNEVWSEVHDRIAELALQHGTTLVFVNTRRLAERTARHLAERLGEENVAAHHGSLSRDRRLDAETRLKEGRLRALVATSSLELGIDIGDVDLAIQLGSTRSIAALLQRVGRANHSVQGLPKGRVFPLSRDELVEAAALLDCVARGELDRLHVPAEPLDILAQQVVAAASVEDLDEGSLFALVRRAWPYRDLRRESFDAVVAMLADGFSTRRGRRGAWIHLDAVNGRIRGRRGARLAALTGGGAIPDTADYDVVLEPTGERLGSVNEDWAIESLAGDVFQLGNASWRIVRVESGKVRVQDAAGQPPNMPFWLGEAPARTDELSEAVCRIRRQVESHLPDLDAAIASLRERPGLSEPAARMLAEHLAAAHAALGVLPTREIVIAERFFDESGGMQLVLHAPFGSRINRAWGLALRKRFCRKFNFELQAAATEDAIVLSLGPAHSFPLEEVFGYLRADTVRDVLVQAMLVAPVFGTRWRWVATRALAVPRTRGGKRTPAPLQRMLSDDLLSAVFPDQAACAENLAGDREVPDHPLVRQAVDDCLHEAMDLDGLQRVLRGIDEGRIRTVARDLREPSPLSAEVLNARPYAFLDDAPLEERRTQAVLGRRWLDPQEASDLGALDAAAIEAVRDEAWPDPRDADELHDALALLGVMTEAEGHAGGWQSLLGQLVEQRRAAVLRRAGAPDLWVAAERLPQLRAALGDFDLSPAIEAPSRLAARTWTAEEATVELVRGRLEALGPVTADRLASDVGLALPAVDQALLALEVEGFVMRGRYTPGADELEWCERRLLARIHRRTIDRLRSEIAAVTAADYLRFLVSWQRLEPDTRAAGVTGLLGVIEQLEGFAAPAAAWEQDLLPARVEGYRPDWLDQLCLSGRVAWVRARGVSGEASGPVRSTPVALVRREELPRWLSPPPEGLVLSSEAAAVAAWLGKTGASFFSEIASGTGLLSTRLEEALAELVGAGLVTCDSFAGLRALLAPQDKRPPAWRRRADAPPAIDAAGRWSLARRAEVEDADVLAETAARALLRRYGVVFRQLATREDLRAPWRDVLRSFRRMEARGELRGGRFVEGFSGEQFALPEAIPRLRAVRRERAGGEIVSVSAVDPACLAGILTPGRRVPALAGNRVLLRDGLPIATLQAGEVAFSEDLPAAQRWDLEKTLRRRAAEPTPAALRA